MGPYSALRTFIKNVAALMEMFDLNQKELAEKSGVPASNLSILLRGENKNPEFATLQKIAEALDVEVWKLFQPEEAATRDHGIEECFRRVQKEWSQRGKG